MRDTYEDLMHVAQLRLKLCQLYQNQEDPEVRQAIDAANQAIGQLTAHLYNQVFNEKDPVVTPAAPAPHETARPALDLSRPRTVS